MNIHNEPMFLNKETIEKIEKQYNGKYVFESCLKTKGGGWTDRAFAIFYTEKKHPEGSNYFAIGWSFDNIRLTKPSLIITNGIDATEEFNGVLYNGEVFYSRFCHDFRQFPNGLFVDGGRDYTRFGGTVLDKCKLVRIRVNKDKLEVVNEEVPDSVPAPFYAYSGDYWV